MPFLTVPAERLGSPMRGERHLTTPLRRRNWQAGIVLADAAAPNEKEATPGRSRHGRATPERGFSALQGAFSVEPSTATGARAVAGAQRSGSRSPSGLRTACSSMLR